MAPKIREVEDEEWQERDLESGIIEEGSTYGLSKGDMDRAKGHVQVWETALQADETKRIDAEVLNYGYSHQFLKPAPA